jgi:alkaline phosphatase
MEEFHATEATAYDQADTEASEDLRIQNLDYRDEDVLNPAPEVGREIGDVTVQEDGKLDYRILADAFTDSDEGDSLTYTATLADGSALPEWLEFSASHHDEEAMLDYFLPGGDLSNAAGSGPATDSASAGTAMSTGEKTVDGNIAWERTDSVGGEIETIAETLREDLGFAIGVASTVPFSHATPAAFVSHDVSRNNYWDIAHEILFDVQPEVVIGGGMENNNFAKSVKSAGNVDRDLDDNSYNDDYDAFVNDTDGTEYVFVSRATGVDGGDTLSAAAAGVSLADGEKLFGLYGTSGGNFEYYEVADNPGTATITRSTGDATPTVDEDPTLAEVTNASLSVLNQDADGFFIMIEQGDIDWTNHGNDYENMIGGVYDLEIAVTEAENYIGSGVSGIDWSNTLVIVTSDHSNSYLRAQEELGEGDLPAQSGKSYPDGEVSYGTGGHTNELVSVSARGAGATYFGELAGQIYEGTEIIDNTQIYDAMMNAATEAGAEHIILFIGDGMNIEHEIAGSRYLYGEDFGLTWHDWGALEDGWTGYASTWDVSAYNKYATTAGVATYSESTYDPEIGYDPEQGGDTPYPVAMTFSGTPDNEDVGTLEIVVTATDESGSSVSQTFGITVENTNDAPTLASPIADQNAAEDAAFSFTVPANTFNDVDAGDTLSYTATLADGSALPGWLSFNAGTRTFSGTALNGNVGTVEVKVTAKDGSNVSASDTFTLTVANVNDSPTLASPIADQNATEDAAFSFTVPANTFNDVDAGDTLSYTATLADGSALPGWLSFNAGTRTFSGTPDNEDVDTLEIRVTVTDESSVSVSDTFNLIVADVLNNGDEIGGSTVELPAGVTAENRTLSTGTTVEQMIYFIENNTNVDGAPDNDQIGTFAAEYEGTQVQELTLSGEASGQSVTIAGGDGDQVMVIDASDLPEGTVIDLDGVEFAIIIGPGTYGGGAGSNVIIADGSSQHIVLGADDDTIYGGAGDDIVGSEGGDDRIYGEAGNDAVFGGDGNDALYGGSGEDYVHGDAGNDTLYGGTGDDLLTGNAGNDTIYGDDAAASAAVPVDNDTVLFSGDVNDYSVGYNSDSDTWTIYDKTAGRDGMDMVNGVETFRFNGTDYSTRWLTSHLDKTVPTVTGYNPADEAKAVAVDRDILITFSEDVMLSNTSGVVLHQGSQTGTAVSATVTVSGSTLTIDPEGSLKNGTDYFVTLADGSVLDLVGNQYEDDDEHDAYHFSTVEAAVAATGGSSDGLGTGEVLAGVAGLGLLALLIL